MSRSLNVKGYQLNFVVGDLVGNTKKILNELRETSGDVDLAVFSELAITGYPPLDLVIRPGFVDEQNRCLDRIIDFTRDAPNLEDTHVVLGVVTRTKKGNGLHNSLVVIHRGEIKHTYHKQLLPTYNIFDEQRLFTPGSRKQKAWMNINLHRVMFFICEDLWSGEGNTLYDERDLVAENKPFWGADLIVSINASPAELGKPLKRKQVFREIVRKHKIPLFYLNQVGGNDDQIYDGNSFYIHCNRKLLRSYHAPEFEVACPAVCLKSGGGNPETMGLSSYVYESTDYMLNMLTLGIKDYVDKCGFKGVTISLSGGVDSALVTTLAVLALGSHRVECTTMPSRYSSEGSVSDSQRLCDNLGIPLYTLAINEVVEKHMDAYEKSYGEPMSPLAQENLQAAIRGNAIMRRSNSSGNLVLIGSNKSEGSVGYFTMFGDSNGGLAPIGDLYKTEVYKLVEYINNEAENHGFGLENYIGIEGGIIPENIWKKEPSAELAPGQKDSNSLPEYPVLDAILKLFIEGDLMDDFEKGAHRRVIANSGIPESEVVRVISLVDKTEYKRRMLAPILRVHSRAFGSGRVLPLAKGKDTHADMWAFR